MHTRTSPSTSARSRRRYLSSLAGLVAGLSLAGCSSDDTGAPESDTPTATDTSATPRTERQSPSDTADRSQTARPGSALGDVIETDGFELVAYGVERTQRLNLVAAADEGKEYAVVEIAVKNRQETRYASFSTTLQLALRDSDGDEYLRSPYGNDDAIDSQELAPGEVARGTVAYEVPAETAGLSLQLYSNDRPSATNDGRDDLRIDLESAGSGQTLTHDLRVPVSDLGEAVEYETTRVTVHSVRTSDGGEFVGAEAGNEFVVVDVAVENTDTEELNAWEFPQWSLKDATGRSDDLSYPVTEALDSPFTLEGAIEPDSTRRGEIALAAPEGPSPLYLVLDFDSFTENDRQFVELPASTGETTRSNIRSL